MWWKLFILFLCQASFLASLSNVLYRDNEGPVDEFPPEQPEVDEGKCAYLVCTGLVSNYLFEAEDDEEKYGEEEGEEEIDEEEEGDADMEENETAKKPELSKSSSKSEEIEEEEDIEESEGEDDEEEEEIEDKSQPKKVSKPSAAWRLLDCP